MCYSYRVIGRAAKPTVCQPGDQQSVGQPKEILDKLGHQVPPCNKQKIEAEAIGRLFILFYELKVPQHETPDRDFHYPARRKGKKKKKRAERSLATTWPKHGQGKKRCYYIVHSSLLWHARALFDPRASCIDIQGVKKEGRAGDKSRATINLSNFKKQRPGLIS